MEIDEEINDKENETRKHAFTGTDEENQSKNIKKTKLFSPKQFRKELNQGNRLAGLKEFLSAINESRKHDYVFEYLESGGNCLELLQTLELDSTIPPVLVFELVTHLLLKISAIHAQYHSSAYESCRYILNNYVTLINKMIGLSSSSQERKVCLKLLTAVVTFSATLAKDVLLHVNFHSTNIELLTKGTGEKDSVRDYFIHFLTAFFVDGHYPTLSILLEKKGFITSIVSGLQYDSADTVCVVISAMKNHILENPAVSKTAKMKIFNTSKVRDIVNLYNWKGPDALKTQKKNKSVTVTVDEHSKAKVSECVHDFLLVLCTSHKFGVIFKDHLMSLGRKNQNALMYTVLESLERPWEHSYARELVTKICGASPDLTKTMWNNLKPFMEPRETPKWSNAMKFAEILIEELQPTCIEFCVKEHNVYQLAQIIQFLIMPLPILKTIIPDTRVFETPSIKRHILSLLLVMLKSLDLYLAASTRWLTVENYKKLKDYMTVFVTKNFIDAKTLLDGWDTKHESDDGTITQSQFLETVFNILEIYRSLAPQLLDNLIDNVELTEFLEKLHGICQDDIENLTRLQIKIINIFVDLDHAKFSAKTSLFSFVLPLLLKSYYDTKNTKALSVLHKLFKNTEVFEGCLHEINIWVNGILNLKSFDERVAQTVVEVLTLTSNNALEFFEELSRLKFDKSSEGNISEIIENLLNDTITKENKTIIIKHRYFSPMVLGFLRYLEGADATKNLRAYSNFVLLNLVHCQTQMEMLKEFAEKHEALPMNIKEYLQCWTDNKEVAFIKKYKGRFDVFRCFSEEFLSGNIDSFLVGADLSLYEDLPLNLLQAGAFYVSNLLVNGTLSQQVVENCEKLVKHLLEKTFFNDVYIATILGHAVLSYNVSFLHLDKSKPQSFNTKLLISVMTELLKSGFNIEGYLKVYREKLLTTILRILHKPQKYGSLSSFIEILRLFNLNYDQTSNVLAKLSDFVQGNPPFSPVIFDILNYSLEQVSCLCEKDSALKPLDGNIVRNLSTYFVVLNKTQDVNVISLSQAFHRYLLVFPHNIEHLDRELFNSILCLNEYSKENVNLAVFLLERNATLVESVKDTVHIVCDKKGVILPLLQVLVATSFHEDILKLVFEKFQPSLGKALQKPQKAGQHFHHNYKGIVALVEKFMPLEKCVSFLEKVHKFEVAEVFHAKLLQAICTRVVGSNVSSKQANSIIMTFVHLQMVLFKRKTKSEEDMLKLNDIAAIFADILRRLLPKIADMDLKTTAQNETLKLYFKFGLKFGVSAQPALLRTLTSLVNILVSFMEKEEGRLIFDMLLSHSEFLNNVLGEHSEVKLEILSLFLVLCKHHGEFMERSHIPVLLAAYRAMVNNCDRTILMLLKMYEGRADQTNFYHFKPILWGRAAASHYSVRQDIENALLRQPKMGDVLEILQEDNVRSTIVNYPFQDSIHLNDSDLADGSDVKSYDMKFLLPLFSQLLAPEQQVQTYKFTRSGALSLTIVSLSSHDKEVRQAACFVLKRFHFHVEARQTGKDNLLWIRYIEAVCKGIGALPEFKLNNFSAIYLARMALILTQPNHVMYVPLAQHLTAKSFLDFSTVPELYTFLHSCDVNFKEHRNFILELLKDGLRTEKDFTDFTRSMAFKLFSESYSSCVSDLDTKLLILDVVKSVCKIPLGVKMLCENHSLLIQIFTAVLDVFKLPNKQKQEGHVFVGKIVHILLSIAKTLQDRHANFMVFTITMNIVKDSCFRLLREEDQRNIFEVLYLVCDRSHHLLTNDAVNVLLNETNDKFCKYVFEYGCNFIKESSLDVNDKYYYLRLLLVGKLKR